jgi:ribosomal protein L6P/L9E
MKMAELKKEIKLPENITATFENNEITIKGENK